MFKLKRFEPTKLEIDITPKQLVRMFPIELQEHPFMGIIERVWKTKDKIYSVKTIPEEFIKIASKDKIHKIVKEEKMLEILSNLDNFEIILFYEDKEDKYTVSRI